MLVLLLVTRSLHAGCSSPDRVDKRSPFIGCQNLDPEPLHYSSNKIDRMAKVYLVNNDSHEGRMAGTLIVSPPCNNNPWCRRDAEIGTLGHWDLPQSH